MPIQSPLEHDEDYLRLLGLVSARWTVMEEGLIILLGHLLGHNEMARSLYLSQGAFRARIELLKSACSSSLEPVMEESVLGTLSKIYDLFKSRNKMIHSPYHAVVKGRAKDPYTRPHLPQSLKTEKVLWIGQGHPNQPERINKGIFLNHLEKLSDQLDRISQLIEITGEQRARKLAAQRARRRRKKPSAPRAPQVQKAS